MTTYDDWYKIKQLEREADRIGLRVTSSRYNQRLALVTKLGCLPGFVNEAEMATGNVEELTSFIGGWDKAVHYFSHLGLVTPTLIKKAEQEIECEVIVSKLAKADK